MKSNRRKFLQTSTSATATWSGSCRRRSSGSRTSCAWQTTTTTRSTRSGWIARSTSSWRRTSPWPRRGSSAPDRGHSSWVGRHSTPVCGDSVTERWSGCGVDVVDACRCGPTVQGSGAFGRLTWGKCRLAQLGGARLITTRIRKDLLWAASGDAEQRGHRRRTGRTGSWQRVPARCSWGCTGRGPSAVVGLG